MKKIIALAIFATTLFSCGNEAEQQKAQMTQDSLQMIVESKDSIINEAFANIDQIASTINQISEREKIVSVKAAGEITTSTKDQIQNNLASISELLIKNRQALASLQATSKKLKAANVKIEALEGLIKSLQSQLDAKNEQLAEMSQKLAALNIEVATLTQSVQMLEGDKADLQQNVAQKTEQLNTVFYIVGAEKELLKKEIIDKEGVIGRTAVVGQNNDMNEFTKTDKRNLERIAVGGKKAKVVTSHPKDSYRVVMGAKNVVEEIIIVDKDEFWRNSKILIISYK